jgi:hypothetical protein
MEHEGSKRETDNGEDEDVGGWIILRWIWERKVGGGGVVDWIGLAQNRDNRTAHVNTGKSL